MSRASAVRGMNCAMPCAPLLLTAKALNGSPKPDHLREEFDRQSVFRRRLFDRAADVVGRRRVADLRIGRRWRRLRSHLARARREGRL